MADTGSPPLSTKIYLRARPFNRNRLPLELNVVKVVNSI